MTPQEPRHATEDLHVDYPFGEIDPQSDGNWTLKLSCGDPVLPGTVYLMVFDENHVLLLNTSLDNPVNFTFNDLNSDGRIGYGDTISLYRGYEMESGHYVTLRIGNPMAFALMKIRPAGLPRLDIIIPLNADGTWTLKIYDRYPVDINNITVIVLDPEDGKIHLNASLGTPTVGFTFDDLDGDGKLGPKDSITFRYSQGVVETGFWVQLLYDNHRFTDAYSLSR